jgi:hypothetical protein
LYVFAHPFATSISHRTYNLSNRVGYTVRDTAVDREQRT